MGSNFRYQISSQYKAYLRTPEWKSTRAAAIRRAQGRCQHCGTKDNLQVHHLNYERLYHELPEDLVVLCKTCHAQAHTKRKYNRGLETYGQKKYGEDWYYYPGYEVVAEEFDEWLEDQE